MRRQSDTDEQIADALYAEGYARERLGDVRLAAAYYQCAVLQTGRSKAARGIAGVGALRAIPSVFSRGLGTKFGSNVTP